MKRLLLLLSFLFLPLTAFADQYVNGNLGVGTSTAPTSAALYVNGNVGVGVAAPSNKLGVSGNANITGNLGIGTTFGNTGLGLVVMNGNVGIGTWGGNGHTVDIMGPANSNTVIGVWSGPSDGNPPTVYFTAEGPNQRTSFNSRFNYPFDILTNNTFALRVDTSQNLGIGTISPASKLAVNGNAAIGSSYKSTAAPSNGMIVQGNTGIKTSAPVNALDVNGGIAVGSYAGVNAALSNGLIVSGNVGIGTSNGLGHVLDVFGGVGTNTIIGVIAGAADGTAPVVYFSADGSAARTTFNSRQNFPFDILTNNTFALRVDTSQNLGIGTVTPKAKLDVTNSGTQLFSVLSGGNVGIGSTNPGVKLDLGTTGTLRAIGIGTTVPQQICRKADGSFGYFDGAWAGTCN